MKFMQHFLSENTEQCKTEHENILNLAYPDGKDALNTSFYFVPQVIYQSVYEHKVDEILLENMYRMSDSILTNGIQSRTDIPNFEFAIIFALNYGNRNKEIIGLAHYIYDNYDLTNLTSSSFYQLFLSVYAKALLETGESLMGTDIFHQVKFRNINIPENMKYYIRIRYMLIEAEFLAYKGKLIKANQELGEIKNIARMLNFNYLYNCALDIEKSIDSTSRFK
jgi:hypothetical protein